MNRAVYGVFIAFASVFIVTTTVQVAGAVFGDKAEPPKVTERCGAHIAALVAGIDAAIDAAAGAPDAEEAKKRYLASRHAASAKASGTAPSCNQDPHAPEALAAVARYDRAAETFAARKGSELNPVRLRAQSFIRQVPR